MVLLGIDAKLARPFLLNSDVSSFFTERWDHVLVPGLLVAPPVSPGACDVAQRVSQIGHW